MCELLVAHQFHSWSDRKFYDVDFNSIFCHEEKVSKSANDLLKLTHFEFLFSKRFDLHKSWHMIDFILNLALSDLLLCVWNITMFYVDSGIFYTNKFLLAILRILIYSQWMSVAFVALARCFGIVSGGRSWILSRRIVRILILFLLRCLAFLLILPDVLEVCIRASDTNLFF